MAAQVDGVRKAQDPECLHRMRVASRKLRNAMDLFEPCLPPKRFKKWFKPIKRVTRALGGARDTDVQINAIQDFLKTLDQGSHSAYRRGIERLLLRLTQRRNGLQGTVGAAMDLLESSGVIQELHETMRGYQAQDRTTGLEALPASLQNPARKTIARRLEDMMVFSPYVDLPDHVAELHQMRIAAKRLRYTLEIYNRLFHEGFKSEIKLVKQIQAMLGEMHDHDVWIHDLPVFLEEEEHRFRVFFGHTRGFAQIARAVRFLMADRQDRRQAVHTQLADFWKQATESGQWDRLRATFDEPVTIHPPQTSAAPTL